MKKSQSFQGSESHFLTDADVRTSVSASVDWISVSGEALCGRDTHAPTSPLTIVLTSAPRESGRLSLMWQVGTSPGYKQINEPREKISREGFKPSQRAFKVEQWLCPGGKSDPAGMFILDRKEAVIVITGSSLFSLEHFHSRLHLNGHPGRPGRCVRLSISTGISFFSPLSYRASIWEVSAAELFLWTLSLINEFLALVLAFTSLFLALGTSVGRGRRDEGCSRRDLEWFSEADIRGSNCGN